MNASRFFGILARIGQRIGAALAARGRDKAPPHKPEPGQDPVAITAPMPASEPASVEWVPASTPLASAGAVPAHAQTLSAQPQGQAQPLAQAQSTAAAPAAAKMRSIEEIRADLARLRQNAKERHAELRAQQQTSFPATDLMEIAPNLPEPKPERAPRDSTETAFAATAFVDFTQVKSRHER
jgi:hypothetical protein